MIEDTNNAQAIIDVAMAAADLTPVEEGSVYVGVVPAGHSLGVYDDRDKAERRGPAPLRRKGTATLTRRESFTAYVLANGSEGEVPDLYADDERHTITAVFNASKPDGPGWGDDLALLVLRYTPEWVAWTNMDGNQSTQVKFAEFIEDHRADVRDPDGATLLEMVQAFEATTNVQFKTAVRLKDGQRQVTYVENTDGRTTGPGGAGTIEFPGTFLIEIPVFAGLDPVHIGARVRYRVGGGNLTIGYILDDTEKLAREAFNAMLAAVEQDTGIAAYHGSPSA